MSFKPLSYGPKQVILTSVGQEVESCDALVGGTPDMSMKNPDHLQ